MFNSNYPGQTRTFFLTQYKSYLTNYWRKMTENIKLDPEIPQYQDKINKNVKHIHTNKNNAIPKD